MKKRNLSALISVYSKDNLNPILEEFKKNKIDIFSTGGTYEYIKKKGPKKFNYHVELEIVNDLTPKVWVEKKI